MPAMSQADISPLCHSLLTIHLKHDRHYCHLKGPGTCAHHQTLMIIIILLWHHLIQLGPSTIYQQHTQELFL